LGVSIILSRYREQDALESGNSHETRELASGDGDGRTGHKAADSRSWDELDQPTDPKQAKAEGDETTNQSQGSSNGMRFPSVAVVVDDVLDDFCDGERHDGDRTNGNILGSGKELPRQICELE
jgi:hypothetical protein